MKKNFIYALMSAMALVGATGFTSCTEEDVVDVNPGYNPDTGEVPVNFVFNVSTGNTPTTRMSAANVQVDINQPFRGMADTKLMSFKIPTVADGGHLYSVDDNTTADKLYGLGTIITASDLDPDGDGSSTYKSKRILELSLPVETSCAMFWGRAAKSGEKADEAQGKIDFTVDKTINNCSFKLVPRVLIDAETTGENPVKYNKAFKQYQDVLAAILNDIVNVEVSYNISGTSGTPAITGTLKWSDYVTQEGTGENMKWKIKDKSPYDNNTDMQELGRILADAFVTLNTINPNELRAGSGPSIAGMLKDLYIVVSKVGDESNPSNTVEEVDKAVGYGIMQEILKYTNGSTWKQLSAIKTQLNSTYGSSLETDLVLKGLEEFPSCFGMPYGSTLLQYDVATNKYSYRKEIPTYDMGGTMTTTFNIYNYMFPAELCYFGNSPLRVTNDTHDKADYPDGASVWDTENEWRAGATGRNNTTDWTTGHVLSSTRSVAVRDNINYGTALLKSTVRFGANKLKDNNAAIQKAKNSSSTEVDAEIDVTKADAFKLTGILIGGQYQEMGWNYVAKAGSAENCMIYDNALYTAEGNKTENLSIPAVTASGGETPTYSYTTTAPNYTLVWDNWNKTTGTQNIVYVALEFVNNTGKNFWGENNLIHNGETFYITGKLDPTSVSTSGIAWPTNYALPPYDSTGSTIQVPRVFIQDYMTTANFVIGETSLHKALVAVPDLRAAQISLGLSVDLSWSTGLTFEDIELGKTSN